MAGKFILEGHESRLRLAVKDSNAPYASLKRITAEQASLLASGLAHAGYESIDQAQEISNRYIQQVCGTLNPLDIDFDNLKIVAPRLWALLDGIRSAIQIHKFIIESIAPDYDNKFDRSVLVSELTDEYMDRLFSSELRLFPEKCHGYVEALRGEYTKFADMLPPHADQSNTPTPPQEVKESGKRPGRSQANASKREKVLAAAMHVMVENLAQDGSMWRNNKPVGARVADYLCDHAFSLFGTYDAPLGKETMAKIINSALTKPEPTDEQ